MLSVQVISGEVKAARSSSVMLKVPWWKMACNLPVNVSTVSMCALSKPLYRNCFAEQITYAALHIVAAFHLSKESGFNFRILPCDWDIMLRFTTLFQLHVYPNIRIVRSIQFCSRNLCSFRNSVISISEIPQFSNSLQTFSGKFLSIGFHS